MRNTINVMGKQYWHEYICRVWFVEVEFDLSFYGLLVFTNVANETGIYSLMLIPKHYELTWLDLESNSTISEMLAKEYTKQYYA